MSGRAYIINRAEDVRKDDSNGLIDGEQASGAAAGPSVAELDTGTVGHLRLGHRRHAGLKSPRRQFNQQRPLAGEMEVVSERFKRLDVRKIGPSDEIRTQRTETLVGERPIKGAFNVNGSVLFTRLISSNGSIFIGALPLKSRQENSQVLKSIKTFILNIKFEDESPQNAFFCFFCPSDNSMKRIEKS